MNQPLTDKNKILITSALPYINGVKHLGNLVGSMLPADLYARFQRLRGKEVLFICATDEHGTPAEIAALAQDKPVDVYCSEMHDLQKILGEGFLLSWDYFGRSSSKQNHQLTQYFHDKLTENGYIYEKTTKQVYSVADKRFLPDRYIEGTCPHCGYEKARGDQCENCTKVLDPTELLNPRSNLSGSNDLEIRETNHLFLKQSVCVDMLKEWINQKKQQEWPLLVTSIAEKWLNEGLIDRGITRDLSWGVPVNREGFEGKVFYVWFDAPIEYIAATKERADSLKLDETAWKKWWKTDAGADDVFYIQFMAKDNIPFHTVSFPITIFGANDNWKVVDYIKGFNWLTYYGGKFSTSSKRGIFMNQALELYGPDYWRWYLLSNIPEGSDSAFTWESFQSTINKDLADVLGNFINRTLKFCLTKFGDKVPVGSDRTALEFETQRVIIAKINDYFSYLESCNIRKATLELRSIWVAGNEYLQTAAPWTTIKENSEKAAMQMHFAINLIKLYAEISKPFIPQSAQTMDHIIIDAVDLSYIWTNLVSYDFSDVKSGFIFHIPNILFAKIDDEDIEKFSSNFGGGN